MRSRARGGGGDARARRGAWFGCRERRFVERFFVCLFDGRGAGDGIYTHAHARRGFAREMPVSRGVHTPHVEYVPSSEFAWGPKGEWSKQSAEDQDFESQYQETSTVEGYDGRIDHLRLKNHEVRLRDEDSKFIPNVKNFAPRPAGWKVGKNKNYL